MDPLDDRLARAGAAWRAAQRPISLPAPLPAAADRRRRAWGRLAPAAGLLAAAMVLLAVVVVVSPSRVLDLSAAASPRPIALLTEDRPAEICELVLISGRLARDPGSGLGLLRADSTAIPVRWPFGWSAYEQAGRAVLVNDSGVPVALDGDPIGFGSAGRSGGIVTACGPSLMSPQEFAGASRAPVANRARPLDAAELFTLAATAHDAADPVTVVATVTIDRPGGARVASPSGDEPVAIGSIQVPGSTRQVSATATVASGLPADGDLTGTFAFRVGPGSRLELLGPVRTPPEALAFDMRDENELAETPAGLLAAVTGWLGLEPQLCPFRDPAASPCDCTGVVIADLAPAGDPRAEPGRMVLVQDDAWPRFGAVPGLDVELPRYGTWLLHHGVEGEDATAPSWSVVAPLLPLGVWTAPAASAG
jgi:hypothetical protein